MRLFVDQRSRQYFAEHGYIHFENLLSEKQLSAAAEASALLVARKMPQLTGLKPRSPDDVMTRGAGLAITDDTLGRLVRSRHLAEVAYEMTNASPLRLGRDLLLTGASSPATLPLFTGPRSLSDVVCYQGMACAALIRLTGESSAEDTIIPPTPGAGVFLGPDTQLDFAALTADVESTFLLIIYLTKRAVYVASDLDPTPHADKELGYAIGDRIGDKGHPTVWR